MVLPSTPFDFGTPIRSVNWVIAGRIAKHFLGCLISQAGVGKTTLAQAMALAVIYAAKLMGDQADAGDVLIIDEDSPTPAVVRYLRLYSNYLESCGYTRQGNLYVRLAEGIMHRHSDKSRDLMEIIRRELEEHPNIKLIILDSLTKLSRSDMGVKDMTAFLAELRLFLHPELGIVFLHHISEHREELSIDHLMTCDHSSLTMYSSAINQNADYIYVLGSPDKGKQLQQLYVRGISKRVLIPSQPFICRLEQGDTQMHFSDEIVLYKGKPSDKELVVSVLLDQDEPVYFDHLYHNLLHHSIGENRLRTLLDILVSDGIIERGKGRHNKAKYLVSPSYRFKEIAAGDSDGAV